MDVPSLRALLMAFLLVAASAAAGCLGSSAGDDEGPDVNATGTGDEGEQDVDNPDGRGRSSAFDETNRTTNDTGGQAHQHDYWKGRSAVVVYDDAVTFSPFPLFPNGQSDGAKSLAYVKLPDSNLVYEGTERVDVLIDNPNLENAPHAAPPGISLEYRTAASSEWSDPVPVTLGEIMTIDVEPMEADMPHSVQSLWVFRLTTDRPDFSTVDMQVTVHRGHDVLDWPGHPDFYADRDSRVIFEEHVKSERNGLGELLLTGAGSSWVSPRYLISHGTTDLHIFANVTRIQSSTSMDATSFFLEYHDATILHDEDDFSERVRDARKNYDSVEDMEFWYFHVEVDPEGMDGPYQPESRWGFRLVATFANAAGVGLCPGCFPYEIEYDLKIVAATSEDAVLLD